MQNETGAKLVCAGSLRSRERVVALDDDAAGFDEPSGGGAEILERGLTPRERHQAKCGGERIRDGRRRGHHGNAAIAVGAGASRGIEDVVEAPGGVERGAVAAGGRKRLIVELEVAEDAVLALGVLEADRPRPARGVPVQGADL